MVPTSERFRSRMQADPTAAAVGLSVACALHLALVFILIPPDMRHESRDDTARRFGYRGPTETERVIRVQLLPSGEAVPVAPRQLIGEIAPLETRPFQGSVEPAPSVRAARVRGAVSTLTEVQRRAVELTYFGGYTHTEVAALLDVPLGTAKTRIRDGLIRLRDLMGVGQ